MRGEGERAWPVVVMVVVPVVQVHRGGDGEDFDRGRSEKVESFDDPGRVKVKAGCKMTYLPFN